MATSAKSSTASGLRQGNQFVRATPLELGIVAFLVGGLIAAGRIISSIPAGPARTVGDQTIPRDTRITPHGRPVKEAEFEVVE